MPVILGTSSLPSTDRNASKTLLLATDLQRSVLAELHLDGPNHHAYIPYGSQSSRFAAGSRLGFNGELKEQPTGWYHLGNGHRVYNPVLMRFHSPDRLSPFGKGGLNAYTYCGGDPINFTDPTGESFAAIFQLVQRGLLIGLHTVIPAGMLLGPAPSGIALHATRFSLLGSAGTAVGAAMSAAGIQSGLYVTAGGTTALLAGAVTRGALAARAAYTQNRLWTTLKNNVKNIVGWPDSTKKPVSTPSFNSTPTSVSTVVNIDNPSVSSTLQSGNDTHASVKVEAMKIRQPQTS